MTIITEIQFFKNDQYITKTLKGDKIEFIKNRLATRKSKNMILEVKHITLMILQLLAL